MGDLYETPICKDCGKRHPSLDYCEEWALSDLPDERIAPYGRNKYGSPNHPNERIEIMITGDAKMAQAWADYITKNAPVLDALPIPNVSWRQEQF